MMSLRISLQLANVQDVVQKSPTFTSPVVQRSVRTTISAPEITNAATPTAFRPSYDGALPVFPACQLDGSQLLDKGQFITKSAHLVFILVYFLTAESLRNMPPALNVVGPLKKPKPGRNYLIAGQDQLRMEEDRRHCWRKQKEYFASQYEEEIDH